MLHQALPLGAVSKCAPKRLPVVCLLSSAKVTKVLTLTDSKSAVPESGTWKGKQGRSKVVSSSETGYQKKQTKQAQLVTRAGKRAGEVVP